MLHSQYTGKAELAVATVTAFAVAAAAGGALGIILLVLIFFVAHLFCSYISGQLGGLTGDTYGATNELLEVVTLLLFFPVHKMTGFSMWW